MTGVPMAQWVEWGEPAVVTAWEVIRGLRGERDQDDGRQMSG